MSGRCPEPLEGPDGRIRPRRLTAIEARNFLQNILHNSSDDEFSVEEEPDSDLDLDDDIEFRPETRSRSSSNAVHDKEQAGPSSGSIKIDSVKIWRNVYRLMTLTSSKRMVYLNFGL